MTTARTIRFILGAIIVLMLGGLVGWYFYLHSQETTTATNDTARGLNTATPSFGGSTGSTEANQAIAGGFKPSTSNGSSASSSTLWKIDAAPVAGMGFVVSSTSPEKLYYVERANGYVFASDLSSRTTVRLTNTLMPKIYQAFVSTDGSIIERSIDDGGNVTTFLGTVNATSTGSSQPATLVGSYLTTNIRSIALNTATRAIFYILDDSNGGVNGFTQSWSGLKKTQVFSSLVGSWLPTWLPDGRIVVLESPQDGMAGFAYQVGATGGLTPILRDIPGLMVSMQSSGHALLFSASNGNSLSLFGQASSTLALLSIQTVAEKCVWLSAKSLIAYCAVPKAPSSNFIQNWYMGITHTTDNWWEVDLAAGTTKLIYSPSSDGASLDVQNPMMDSSGNYIVFTNGTDQSLWALNVTQ